MNKKPLSTTLIILSLLALLAIFTLAGAAASNGKVYLPAVFSVSGKPPTKPTATPEPTATPKATATPTPVPRHFDDCAFGTGENATIAVKTDVTINGSLVLEKDDEIAIFTPDGSICAGMKPWSGENIAITAWGDNSITEEIDGLRSGEEMAFRIWDKSESKEIAVKEVAYSFGDGVYVVDGIYIVESFTLE